jgi:hypothetical protein
MPLRKAENLTPGRFPGVRPFMIPAPFRGRAFGAPWSDG